MKPLRETDTGDAVVAKARSLVEAVGPLPESEARKQRVRRALDRPRAGVFVALRRLPAVAIVGLIALFGASAFAAVRLAATYFERPEPQAQRVVAVSAPTGVARQMKQAEPESGTEPEPEPEPEAVVGIEAETGTEAETVTETKTGSVRRRAVEMKVRRRKGPEPEAEAATPEQLGHDSALVHRAVQALRRDGKPALAARLLAEHRQRFPEGPLAEEVLALQIEAAGVLGDPRARVFARSYLARFPAGRYAKTARQALAEPEP